MKIVTNGHPRHILYPCDLTRSELESIEPTESFRGFRYRGTVYDLANFCRIVRWDYPRQTPFMVSVPQDSPLLPWDELDATSLSGVIIRYVDDEHIIAGRILEYGSTNTI